MINARLKAGRALAIGLASLVAAAAAAAQPTPAPGAAPAAAPEPRPNAPGVVPGQLAPSQKEIVAGINKYFNSIKTMSGAFVQFGPDGRRSEGTFQLAKPGRIFFGYAKPATLEIVADGYSVVVKDNKLKTKDLYPLSKTPLRFLLAEKLDLTSDANVTQIAVEPDLVTVVVEESSVFGSGKLSLVFDRKNYELKQWTVTDGQGDTSVAIYNVQTGKPVDMKKFEIPAEPRLLGIEQ